MNPIIVDADTGHELWTARQCASHCDVARSSWTTYCARGAAPAAVTHYSGLTLWDSEEVKRWHSERPSQKRHR